MAGSDFSTAMRESRTGFRYNRSVIHTDIMFGSTEVTIVATKTREGEVVLIDRGEWSERFLAA